MEFNPGTGATIQAVTLENQCYSIARSIQNLERSATYNPGDEINLITSSSDDDTQIFSGSCEIYINKQLQPNGITQEQIPNPYTNLPAWNEGTDGQGASNSWVEGLTERFLALAFHERNQTYNVSNLDPKITTIDWKMLDSFVELPVIHNCILSFNFRLDFRITDSTAGTTTEAVPYLQGIYPGIA